MSAPVSGGIDLNPTLADLLTLHAQPPLLIPTLLAGAWYAWRFVQSRRTPPGRARWPLGRAVLFALGWALLLLTTQSRAATLTQSSMALYMTRLMILAEIVPPLLVLGIPRGVTLNPRRGVGRVLNALLDPWLALAVWTAVIV
ncbi:cytochrome c oxidase assembly protein, partial [Deinococcus sp.]|uniref:cytochrome c oxidase assembly protein n=1 Tax=Deinococcus sp. TaxID=47478 RepID=UPI002869E5C8